MGRCCVPSCGRPVSDRLSIPVCVPHAKGVYFQVRDLLEHASVSERAASARPPKVNARPEAGRQAHWVYFAQVGELVKIGYSTNPDARMKAIGGTLLHTVRGTMHDEKAMHARFGPCWERGEYFRREGALAEYLDAL